ncbi:MULTISPECIES: hypothetical protein [unclassified Enterococcus]|uniref:hypothetical protein n=1 Tax=unclassified Enterococcus TaxID=2608891 RepID=UPI001551F23A|nr:MULTISPECIES: hypothetical protein [unclassified Enterococcus]MBS7576561.1 hypothetical protein [Enterococcus sp. MMGLQ5-2]MBS7583952.1 hypothetical protein [Enterococcus sp. MMGLQ5-1]NPD11813.1 hypothetical protein [Enterococcus sp. MMGLQ5-1]NPD36398.1 hypothetical protein [Enterococcus sp. MMGLQ5-2]
MKQLENVLKLINNLKLWLLANWNYNDVKIKDLHRYYADLFLVKKIVGFDGFRNETGDLLSIFRKIAKLFEKWAANDAFYKEWEQVAD